VATLVSYGRYPYHKYGQSFTQQDHEAVEKALSQVQLHDLRNSLLTRLSGGQRQRAFIAMALAQDTDIVFLDEPTTYLDINIRLELMELVRFLNGQGKTIIMVLHDLNLALENSHNIVLLERGKLYAEGSPDQVIETGLLDKVFNIQTHVFHKDGKTFHHFSRQKS
jgi:iron complex transport system ATP-binding protein